MGTAPYISTVISICLLALGANYALTGQLGRRIDALAATMNVRFDDVNVRFDGVNSRFDSVDRRVDDLRMDMDARFTGFRVEVDARLAGVEGRLGRLETQGDLIIGAVSDLGERVTRLEARTAS